MMNTTMLSWICCFIFLLFVTVSRSENKTSSECWACTPKTPHVLNCTGAGVIVIQSANYGYKGGCGEGITSGAGCTIVEINRCCKPGGPGRNCFKSFNVRDREELEKTCSNNSTCTFNSIRHDQPFNCESSINNSYTLINYTCQTSESLPNVSSIKPSQAYDITSSMSPSKESTHPVTTKSSDQDTLFPESGNDDNGGTTAAIIICVLLVIIVAAIVLFFFIRKRKIQNDKHKNTTSLSSKREIATATNPAKTTSPIYHIVASDTSLPKNPSYEQTGDVMANMNQSHAGSQGRHLNTYHQIDDSDLIQNKPDDGYTEVDITNTALGEDDYHHIGGDNSNNIVNSDETYNHINHAGKQLDKDDYHHIDVNNSQETVDTEYNHIGPGSQLGLDDYEYNRFGDIKPEVTDNDHYNHIGNVN